jgi:hypothetical protein
MAMSKVATRHDLTSVQAPELIQPRIGRTRRITTRMVSVAVVLAVVIGSLGGYLTYRAVETRQARQTQVALLEQEAVARGQRANAARWAGMAYAYLQSVDGLTRGQRADAARWAAQAKAWIDSQKAEEAKGSP